VFAAAGAGAGERARVRPVRAAVAGIVPACPAALAHGCQEGPGVDGDERFEGRRAGGDYREVDFDCCGDPQRVGIPCLVVRGHEGHPNEIGPHDAGNGDNESKSHQESDYQSLS